MMNKLPKVVVAGEICLDIIPRMDTLTADQFRANFRPGRMLEVGEALLSAGGAVANTGLALHILGIPARLMGKVGADRFGEAILQLISSYGAELVEDMIVDPAATTSYTLVFNPPGLDRMFLHHPGANHTFRARDVEDALVAQADLFHFGYPPVMESMYRDEGRELAEMFHLAKSAGVITSLDTTFPDPTSPGGQADWRRIFRNTLLDVDIFLPSIEETLFMLHRPLYEALTAQAGGGRVLPLVTPALLAQVSQELLEMGARVVALKVGERGLYLRTARKEALDAVDLSARRRVFAGLDTAAWADQELWAPCFQVEMAGTTGSGDATIAGFLSGLLRGLLPAEAITAAVAVGACNVEAADALGGLCSWEATLERIGAGWPRHRERLTSPGWRWDEARQVWVGPA